ncbi:MAG: DUF86 domain-containing protein [Chloroflexi bacterium]|nr:DUF86 domain-containing protein [Chloroflexota bacterium]
MKSERDYLLDMLSYTRKIADFTRDGREAFFADEKTQLAVIRAYEVIGEIAKRLPDDLLAQQPQTEWKQIKGFRDFLAHNYDEVALKIVWGAVEQLSDLSTSVEAMLSATDESVNDEK